MGFIAFLITLLTGIFVSLLLPRKAVFALILIGATLISMNHLNLIDKNLIDLEEFAISINGGVDSDIYNELSKFKEAFVEINSATDKAINLEASDFEKNPPK